MGSPVNEAGRFDSEGPQHPVTVRAFALGKFDITSEQFLEFLKETAISAATLRQVAGSGLAFSR